MYPLFISLSLTLFHVSNIENKKNPLVTNT